jgi:diguanylate cyclase (GGDEF)-like protein
MVLLAPETDRIRAAELGERIRQAVESQSFLVGKSSTGVTVSVGVAVFPRDAKNGLDLVAKADKAMYAAKESGRNRLVLFENNLDIPEKMIDTPLEEG